MIKAIEQNDIQRATLDQILHNRELKRPSHFKPQSSDKVYDYVVRNICNYKFKEGMRLAERDLAEQLHLSHIPVREAIKKLEYNGWIRHEPHKGATVREFTLTELREIYMLREVVESGIIRKVAGSITTTQLAELKQVLDLLTAANETNNFEVYRDADFEFHRLIVEYAGSRRLLAFYETLIVQMRFCCFEFWRIALERHLFKVKSLQSSAVTHKMIYDALVGHSMDWAEQLLRKHLADSCSINGKVLEMMAEKGGDIKLADKVEGDTAVPDVQLAPN
jgi:DNA-binding GntR family transcriptional regulator